MKLKRNKLWATKRSTRRRQSAEDVQGPHRQRTRRARLRPPRPATKACSARHTPRSGRNRLKPPPWMHAKVDELAHIMTLEMGKRINEAREKLNSAPASSPIAPRTPSASWRTSNSIQASATVIWRAARSEWSSVSSHGTFLTTSSPAALPVRIRWRAQRPAGEHVQIAPECAIAFEKLWIEAGAPLGLYQSLRSR